MVTKGLLITLSISYVAGRTNIDDLVSTPGDWWEDDYAYDENGAVYDLDLNTWYQGTPDSQLGGTSSCTDCLDPGSGNIVHGWWWNTAGSYDII